MAFLPNARHLLRQFDATMDDLADLVARRRGRVTIACLPSVASRLMPRVIAMNEQLYPGLRVQIRDGNLHDVMRVVLSGETELGIGSGLEHIKDLASIVLAHDRYHAVVPASSPLTRRRLLDWSDLAEHPFVALFHQTGIREHIDEVID